MTQRVHWKAPYWISLILAASALVSWSDDVSGQSAHSPSQQPLQRQQILDSPRWRRLERTFHEWLSVQTIYTASEIEQAKAQLRHRIQTMSVPELEDFMDDAEDRLTVLLSDQANEARAWLGFLTPQARRNMVASGGYVPNVFAMNASQLRQELSRFQQQRASRAAAHQGFERSRDQQVARAQEDWRFQQEQAMAARRNAAAFDARNYAAASPLAPRPLDWTPERPTFYVNAWGGIGRVLP